MRVTFVMADDDWAAAIRLHRTAVAREYIVEDALYFVVCAVAVWIVPVLAPFAILFVAATLVWPFAYSLSAIDRLIGRIRLYYVRGMPCTVQVSSRGVSFSSSPSANGDVPWSEITAVRNDKQIVVLERQRVLVAWAPAIAFSSAADFQGFVQFARRQIGR